MSQSYKTVRSYPTRSGTFLAKTINISVNFQALNKVFHFLLVAEDRNIKKLAPIAMSFYSVMEVYYILSPSDIVHNVILFHNRLFYLVITKIVHLKSFGQLVRPGSIVRLTRSVKSFGLSCNSFVRVVRLYPFGCTRSVVRPVYIRSAVVVRPGRSGRSVGLLLWSVGL